MQQAIDLALGNVTSGNGGPFGAIVVSRDTILGTGVNQVTAAGDPTAHAEIVAIREACRKIGSFQLAGCELYTSCEPCPMCLGAIYWARLDRFYYSATREAAQAASFGDAFIYDELQLPPASRSIPGFLLLPERGARPFDEWKRSLGRVPY